MSKHISKNNLKELLFKKGMSQSTLAKKTQLDKGTIRKIINNEFHDMKLTTIRKLMDVLEVDWDELIISHEKGTYFWECLIPHSFNKKNIALLREKVYENDADLSFEIQPYSNDCKANLTLKNKKLNIIIDMNISVFWTERGITLTIVDFGMSNNKEISFKKYKKYYENFLRILESYAFDINIDAIRFNIRSYQNPIIKGRFISPQDMNDDELKEILKLVDSYGEVNSILKWSILLSLNYYKFYELFEGSEHYQRKTYKDADNYLLTDRSITIFEREKKRQQFYNSSFELSMNDRYLYKIFNENSKNKIIYKRLSDFV
ncbi:helix-turn-helix domain-containing protein [Staphylococcus pseudoxylosus]|uniref:helix-turn-helix domain-containing protein n=1 Tax=Staphylococcus pseudoxylosus TaxID=2282419 RepID=UPI002DBB16D3|nr:helix-turn-helix transcriptional regulator [Staphylococcus pseudoxylosus]MEB7754907.1 helix-turn-helix transcriptional regulator [Staphylococcus pseudoxylosus]